MIRKSVRLTLAALLVAGCGATQAFEGGTTPEGAPSLVLIVAVDQLRPDMLDRYDALFTGGLRRLLDEGYRFPNAAHGHAETTTSPGHATLATGVHPSRHGIVGNDWFVLEGDSWREIYSVEDLDSPILGIPEMEGRSPANLLRQGLPDWIQAASADARVVSISRKDRSAIGLAGTARGEVYWLPSRGGRFITSTFYHTEYPDWVRRFNEREMPRIYADTLWESTISPEQYSLSRPDTSAYELDGNRTFFPHRASEIVDVADPGDLNRWRFDYTPFPDAAVLALAQTAIRELRLGRRSSVDYLGLAFSQTDIVGHKYGPFSREQLDNLLRLDRLLGDLLTTLDREVGPGRWVLALSSDHGVLEIPEHLSESGESARRLSREERAAVRQAVQDAVEAGLEGEALANRLKESLSALPHVEAAYTFREVENPDAAPDSFAVFFGRSHSRDRVLSLPARHGVHVRFPPNVLEGTSDATTHGSPYFYDRSVPLIFLGNGLEPGISEEPVLTVDVAPTLAGLAGITPPADLDGRNLFGSRSP